MRELDAQIAERVMGWEGVAMSGDELTGAQPVTTPNLPCETVWGIVPAYSTDLNACATAEARIISMGLGARYADALRDVVGPLKYGLSLITASAEHRCHAILATLERKGGAPIPPALPAESDARIRDLEAKLATQAEALAKVQAERDQYRQHWQDICRTHDAALKRVSDLENEL